MGSLRPQTDLQLLLDLATRRPDWSFVFVGNAANSTLKNATYQALSRRQNVYLFGQKPADQIPQYLRGFNVGLMPYITDSAAKFCQPLKLHEYLAAGLPVISSAIPAVQDYLAVVTVANTVGQWIDAIEVNLKSTSCNVALRQHMASQNTWDYRVQQISCLLSQSFEKNVSS
jgi:glycosyltransferase involved in cell wall biosynthesis